MLFIWFSFISKFSSFYWVVISSTMIILVLVRFPDCSIINILLDELLEVVKF